MTLDTITSSLNPQLIAFAVAGVVLATFLLSGSRRKGAAPPGPRGWPLIGNVLDIPPKDPWKVYLQWSQDYSKHYYILLSTTCNLMDYA